VRRLSDVGTLTERTLLTSLGEILRRFRFHGVPRAPAAAVPVDRAGKYEAELAPVFWALFDEVFRAEGIEILRTPWRAPKANAYAERFIRTVRTECLDRVLPLGERHLRAVLETYVEHYNCERPHRGLDLQAPEGTKDVSPLTIHDSVKRRDLLGGLIHEYYRRAA